MAEKGRKKKNPGFASLDADSGKTRLIDEILANAGKEAEEIIAQAEKTKEQKIAAAGGKAGRLIKDAEMRGADKSRQILEQNKASIRIRAKRIALQQSEEIIAFVFDEVKKRIAELAGSDEYRRVLQAWAAEAVFGVGSKEVVLSTSAKERPRLDDGFLEVVCKRAVAAGADAGLEIRVSETPESDYGICARSADGRLEYRNQLQTRLRRNETEYRKKIYAHLGIEGV